MFTLLEVGGLEQLVEDVEVALNAMLEDNTRLLQEIVHNRGRVKISCHVKIHLDELSETRRVVVLESLGITEGFQQWI